RGAAEIVGQRHHRAAMHGAKPIVELLAHEQLGFDLVLGKVGDLHPHEIGKRRLQFGSAVHNGFLCVSNQGRGRSRALITEPKTGAATTAAATRRGYRASASSSPADRASWPL